jgi:hypothetical protein
MTPAAREQGGINSQTAEMQGVATTELARSAEGRKHDRASRLMARLAEGQPPEAAMRPVSERNSSAMMKRAGNPPP